MEDGLPVVASHLLPERVFFVCFDADVYNAYQAVWHKRWADQPEHQP